MTILLTIVAFFALVAFIVQRNSKAHAEHSAHNGNPDFVHHDDDVLQHQHQHQHQYFADDDV